MTFNLKKEHVTNWDLHNVNEKTLRNMDRDSTISERTSIPSLDDFTPPPAPRPKPTDQQIPDKKTEPKKPGHTLRYHYNELPENGIPLATQYKIYQKQEKQRQKNIRKAPPGQGKLALLPEKNPIDQMPENYYPYKRYYNVTRRKEPVDPSEYLPEPPPLSISSIKPQGRSRKSDKLSSEKQYIPLKDGDTETSQRYRRKRRKEPDWAENYFTQSIADQTLPSIPSSNPSDQSKTHRHHRRHHRHHHHHHHHHHRPQQPSQLPKEEPYTPSPQYLDTELQVNDYSFKPTVRSPFFQRRPTPPTQYVPPVSRELHTRISPILYYYGTLSQSTVQHDWKEPSNELKIYRPDRQTQFYDRYLNNVIERRLSAL